MINPLLLIMVIQTASCEVAIKNIITCIDQNPVLREQEESILFQKISEIMADISISRDYKDIG